MVAEYDVGMEREEDWEKVDVDDINYESLCVMGKLMEGKTMEDKQKLQFMQMDFLMRILLCKLLLLRCEGMTVGWCSWGWTFLSGLQDTRQR